MNFIDHSAVLYDFQMAFSDLQTFFFFFRKTLISLRIFGDLSSVLVINTSSLDEFGANKILNFY